MIRGKTGRAMELLKGLMEVECIGWEEAAGTSRDLRLLPSTWPPLTPQPLDVRARPDFFRSKGVNYKGAPKGGGKDQEGKWSGNGGKGSVGPERDPSADLRAEGQSNGMSCGRSGEIPSGRPLETPSLRRTDSACSRRR